jgi:hypothetical protein
VGRIERDGAELLTPCDRCGGTLRGQVSEIAIWGRVEWSVSWRCDCGNALEVDECDEISGIHRAALVADAGLTRLRADAAVNAAVRVYLLAVFRRDDVTIAEAVAAYARLTSEGIIGTPARTRLLADRLTAAGATVTLEALPGDT